MILLSSICLYGNLLKVYLPTSINRIIKKFSKEERNGLKK